jgi:Mn2+/Fe2+ NRAMP family transporter
MSTESDHNAKPAPRGLALIGPGLLVAATGVGAGDLATGALAGARLGTAVLWAVLLGAFIKFVLTEGLARWQLATDSTILEGTRKHFGSVTIWLFLAYLCVWSFLVGGALMSACGIAAHAIFDLTGDATRDKQVYGIIHSGLAVVLVCIGGYRLFEKAMRICIGVMFATVLVAAVAVKPDWGAVLSGLVVPVIPELNGPGLKWTIGLMGGVGGTVTVLCYGYWIREENRRGLGELKTCRIDLMAGYLVTAVFGLCMVILGSELSIDEGSKGARLIVALGDNLHDAIGGGFGTTAKWAFLLGAWGAIASSMLGVWQSVPYLFADCWRLTRKGGSADSKDDADIPPERHPIYRRSLIAIAIFPAALLFVDFTKVQLTYAIVGAVIMPLLALALLCLNGTDSKIGAQAKNSKATTVVLALILALFVWAGVYQIRDKLTAPAKKEPPPAAATERVQNDFLMSHLNIHSNPTRKRGDRTNCAVASLTRRVTMRLKSGSGFGRVPTS